MQAFWIFDRNWNSREKRLKGHLLWLQGLCLVVVVTVTQIPSMPWTHLSQFLLSPLLLHLILPSSCGLFFIVVFFVFFIVVVLLFFFFLSGGSFFYSEWTGSKAALLLKEAASMRTGRLVISVVVVIVAIPSISWLRTPPKVLTTAIKASTATPSNLFIILIAFHDQCN